MNKSFTVDDFYKYKSTNTDIIEDLKPFMVGTIKKHRRPVIMHETEIKAYLTTHIQKRNNDTNDEVLYDKVQSLLNKLSNTNFMDISREIRELPYNKSKHIYRLCEKVIIKGIHESNFADTYAKLCQSLLPYYIKEKVQNNDDIEEKDIYFRSGLLVICQTIFDELVSGTSKNVPYEKSIDYKKLKLSGLCKFLGELYNNNVINDKIVEQCCILLYKNTLNGNDFCEHLSVYMTTVIPKLSSTQPETLNRLMEHVSELRYEKNGFKFAKSLSKFKILEIYDEIDKVNKMKK